MAVGGTPLSLGVSVLLLLSSCLVITYKHVQTSVQIRINVGSDSNQVKVGFLFVWHDPYPTRIRSGLFVLFCCTCLVRIFRLDRVFFLSGSGFGLKVIARARPP
jgi:hypothetical protein